VWRQPSKNSPAHWPELAASSKTKNGRECDESELKVVHYIDDHNVTLYLPAAAP
jgi:hypothetical protein